MTCSHCGQADLIGPFEMDGMVDGQYRPAGEWWTVCRTCHRSDHREAPTVEQGALFTPAPQGRKRDGRVWQQGELA